MGRVLVLKDTKLTDRDAPILPVIDRIESSGSLYLIDFTHPYDLAPAGAESGMLVPNLFGKQLASLSGKSALDPVLRVGGGLSGAKGRMERSSKGGLHGIVSQSVRLAAGDGAGLSVPEALRQYLFVNKSHSYYFSAWDRLTRPTTSVQDWVAAFAIAGNVVHPGVAAHAGGWTIGGTSLLGLGNIPGPRRACLAAETANMESLLPANAGAGPQWGAPDGMLGSAQISLDTRNLKWPSSIAYRFYVEDLTVSGRSPHEVAALDAELYTKEVLSMGGRYYGDTFTDPATVP